MGLDKLSPLFIFSDRSIAETAHLRHVSCAIHVAGALFLNGTTLVTPLCKIQTRFESLRQRGWYFTIGSLFHPAPNVCSQISSLGDLYLRNCNKVNVKTSGPAMDISDLWQFYGRLGAMYTEST